LGTNGCGTGVACKRILFRKGKTFTSSVKVGSTASGPGIIGSDGASGAKPAITVTGSVLYDPVIGITGDGWRIMDLSMDGTGTTGQYAIGPVGSDWTILRLDTNQLFHGVNNYQHNNLTIQDSTILNNTSGSGSAYCVYVVGNYVAVMGSYMEVAQVNGHTLRSQDVNYYVYSNNKLLGISSYTPITIRGNSQYGIISDNYTEGNLNVNPQNATTNETEQDYIIERNSIHASDTGTQLLGFAGVGGMMRNNILYPAIDATHNQDSIKSNYTNTAGGAMTTRNEFYNNTIYDSSSGSAPTLVTLYSGLSSICTLKYENNIYYGPSITGTPTTLYNGGSCVVNGGSGSAGVLGNTAASQIKATNPFSGTPSTIIDLRIPTTSYANDGTTNSPQNLYPKSDFLNCRSTAGTSVAGAFIPATQARCRGGK